MKYISLFLLVLLISSCAEKRKPIDKALLYGRWDLHTDIQDSLYISIDSIDKSLQSMMDKFVPKAERGNLSAEDSMDYISAFMQEIEMRQSIYLIFTDSTIIASGVDKEWKKRVNTTNYYEWVSDKSIFIPDTKKMFNILSLTDTTLTLKDGSIEGKGMLSLFHRHR